MIKFKNLNQERPYRRFFYLYNKAENNKQPFIEAFSLSSYDNKNNIVDSRYVNLKYIENNSWIFFSNYHSPKAFQFKEHNQISVLFFWNTINTQVRVKAKIKKVNKQISNEHFKKRSREKNAIAISSKQSKTIKSYDEVKRKYQHALKANDLENCPDYWGGYSFTPYYFEFWEGHESRINKREIFEKIDDVWEQSFLQP